MKKNQVVDQLKKEVEFTADSIKNSPALEYSGCFISSGIDNAFDYEEFEQNLKINILSKTKTDMTFEIIGIDAPIANAFRRILIAEVPTMCIDQVTLYQNTSVLPDEVFCHRLGLIPLDIDPDLFEYKQPEEEFHEKNGLFFKLHVRCSRKPEYNKLKALEIAKMKPEDVLINSVVYSGDLKWEPIGNQAQTFKDRPPKPLIDNIVLAELRENQEIEVEMYVEKGIGKVHAKWSPVATAYYKLMTKIELEPGAPLELASICPQKVFDIEDSGKSKTCKVSRPGDCTMCRECLRHENVEKYVKLKKIRDHFLFTIESVGAISPEKLFINTLKIFKERCIWHKNSLIKLEEEQLKR